MKWKKAGHRFIKRFAHDLKQKLSQRSKGKDGLTILNKNFKFFDAKLCGKISFKEFSQALERSGVFFESSVLLIKKVNEIFDQFAHDGLLDYMKFTNEMFEIQKTDITKEKSFGTRY